VEDFLSFLHIVCTQMAVCDALIFQRRARSPSCGRQM
jgi:hypothetical protein